MKRFQTIVIGGGQAGLAVGYHLARRAINFEILDAHARIGDAWRRRWDSLRLFSPARYDGLPGLPFPAAGGTFPSKDEMADYLETYAAHFRLPVRTSTRVNRVSREGTRFIITAGRDVFEADTVVVAMGSHQEPRVPAFANQLSTSIRQLHSFEYRNPSQLKPGGVLVVGVGNSGADIALDLSRTHQTWLAGKESGHLPPRIDGFWGRHVLTRIIRFVGHHVLTVDTAVGRRVRPKLLFATAPLIRVKPQDLVVAGVERVGRVAGAADGRPRLDDGRLLDVANVIWCTGFTNGLSWIDLPIFDAAGQPKHDRGVVQDAPGLYFVGQHFLYAMSSETVGGVGRDAKRIVDAVARRLSAEHPVWQAAVGTGNALGRAGLTITR